MKKSYEEINEKIRQGKAVVLTAEEVLAVRNYHQEECGYEFCAWFGL